MKRIWGYDYFACLEVKNLKLFLEKWNDTSLQCPHTHAFGVRSQNFEERLFGSSCLSEWNNSAPTGRIFMKFGI